MKIEKNIYYGVMYYLEVPPGELKLPFGTRKKGGNVLVTFYTAAPSEKPEGATNWLVESKFRYYNEGPYSKPDDRVNTHTHIAQNCTESAVEGTIVKMLGRLASANGLTKFECLNIRAVGDEAMEKIKASDKAWLKVKK